MDRHLPCSMCCTPRQHGQSFVEFALTLPILLLILMGVLDVGRAFFIGVALEDAAGEAAMYLSVFPNCPTASSGAQCADPNNAVYRAQHAGGGQLKWSNVTVEKMAPEATGAGVRAEVVLKYRFDLLTPVIPDLVGAKTVTISGDATQVMVAD